MDYDLAGLAVSIAATLFGWILLRYVSKVDRHDECIAAFAGISDMVKRLDAFLATLQHTNFRIESLETDVYAIQASILKIREENHSIRDTHAGMHIDREIAKERRKENDEKFKVIDTKFEAMAGKFDRIFEKLEKIADRQSTNYDAIRELIDQKQDRAKR